MTFASERVWSLIYQTFRKVPKAVDKHCAVDEE
jgi:hypothetical protein